MALEGTGTIMIMSPDLLVLYSAAKIKQTLQPIDASKNLRRTINGVLKSLGQAQFQLYESEIAGEDLNPLAVDGIFPGATVVVDCVVELGYLTGVGSSGGFPERTVVPGTTPRVVGDHTLYRPRLTMMITDGPSLEYDEWGAVVGWKLTLEEVGG